MMLSDLSVRRPVLAAVLSLLLIAFGAVAFNLLPLREYPDIDPPIVTVAPAGALVTKLLPCSLPPRTAASWAASAFSTAALTSALEASGTRAATSPVIGQ